MLLLEQMAVLFLLMGIGYLCSLKGIITDEVSKKLSAIVVNVANPALVLSGALGEEKIQGEELLMTIIIIIVVYLALLLTAQILPALLRVEKGSRGTYKAMTVFSNIGFMGFPVVAALYGNGAILYAALFTIPYNILIYTYGISSMSAGEKEQTAGESETSGMSFLLGRILNVGVIACIVTMIIYFFRIPVPKVAADTITHLSNLTAPLSMMVIGASLASINLKKLFMDVRLLLFSAIKLLLIPMAGMLVIRQFVNNEIICGVCLVMLATPVGSMTAMLAQQYDGDYEMASKGVALTTILSVATIPLVSMLVM
ncbi:MAG: AEC family transporter [Lachnospiraceae bacterium]|nr:AEC family transporter [Lachnospiraceae bacterium]